LLDLVTVRAQELIVIGPGEDRVQWCSRRNARPAFRATAAINVIQN
jgi:hypothetical protein